LCLTYIVCRHIFVTQVLEADGFISFQKVTEDCRGSPLTPRRIKELILKKLKNAMATVNKTDYRVAAGHLTGELLKAINQLFDMMSLSLPVGLSQMFLLCTLCC
jgi:hypothetical protein